MSRSKYTDALCVLLIALMLLTLLLFRWGEALGIEKVERESALSAASAKAVIALTDEYIKVKGDDEEKVERDVDKPRRKQIVQRTFGVAHRAEDAAAEVVDGERGRAEQIDAHIQNCTVEQFFLAPAANILNLVL